MESIDFTTANPIYPIDRDVFPRCWLMRKERLYSIRRTLPWVSMYFWLYNCTSRFPSVVGDVHCSTKYILPLGSACFYVHKMFVTSLFNRSDKTLACCSEENILRSPNYASDEASLKHWKSQNNISKKVGKNSTHHFDFLPAVNIENPRLQNLPLLGSWSQRQLLILTAAGCQQRLVEAFLLQENKLAKLSRCVSRHTLQKYTYKKYTFKKYILEKYTLEIEVWKLLVIAFRKYITSRGLRPLLVIFLLPWPEHCWSVQCPQ